MKVNHLHVQKLKNNQLRDFTIVENSEHEPSISQLKSGIQ